MESSTFQLAGQTLRLHPFRAAYWVEAGTLLLADLHLGKAAHFRRNGLAVPNGVSEGNWDRLLSLLVDFRPARVLFLGDLFHSEYNAEWESLADLIRQFDSVAFELSPGNHDILAEEVYTRAGLIVRPEEYREGPFLFSHHPLPVVPEDAYNLAGHVHPGVFLRGRGRQRLRLPCFYFGKRQGLLPAFGAFTGLGPVAVRNGDRVFVIADDRVIGVGQE